jgi:hydroxymethylglutaryl-CoA reductase
MQELSMATQSTFSYAPGKAILVGEHAVVYGSRAIAMPVENGVRVAVVKLAPDQIANHVGPLIRGMGLFLGDVSLAQSNCAPPTMKAALSYIVELFGPKTNTIGILVDGSLPPGRGLGSSAALSVALLKGVSQYFGRPFSVAELSEHAAALETIFHGRASGIDHSVVINGQVIGFQKAHHGTSIKPLPLKENMTFVVGITGPHEGTKNAVLRLSERRARHPQLYDRIFLGLDDLAGHMEEALATGQSARVGELMNIAQGYLNALSVSTAELERLCHLARSNGALGAKLTGAGGGGAVIALVHDEGHDLANAFRGAGYQSFVTVIRANHDTKNVSKSEPIAGEARA